MKTLHDSQLKDSWRYSMGLNCSVLFNVVSWKKLSYMCMWCCRRQVTCCIVIFTLLLLLAVGGWLIAQHYIFVDLIFFAHTLVHYW